jgi:hypothetical protein
VVITVDRSKALEPETESDTPADTAAG